jgi:pilus assembly protein CpaF
MQRDPLDDRVHRRVLAIEGHEAVGDEVITELVRSEDPLLDMGSVRAVVTRVRARIDGVGAIEPLLSDPSVSDVLVNGPGRVWVERRGRLTCTEVQVDRAAIDLLVERIVARLGLRADRSTPIVDARLPDGSRVHVVLPPLAVDGPCVTIRRFAAVTLPLARFCGPEVAELLMSAVAAAWNVVMCGSTGAGKTTLSTPCASTCPTASGSSPSRTPPSCGCPGRTSCGWSRGPRPPTGWPRSPSATWSERRCGCGPTASSSERSVEERPWT